MKIYIGTSGYSYKHWADGVFYPKALSQKQWLEYYSKYFNSVELNVTFYRLPNKKTFESWYEKTPQNFVFIAKGSRYITHIKRLKEPENSIRIFFENVEGLKDKLKVILWQFAANFSLNYDRFSEFCKGLKNNKFSKSLVHAFEFRNKNWFCKQIYDILNKYNFCLCIAHSDRWPCIEEVTSDFIYLRFHGGVELYGSNYSERELKTWAEKSNHWISQGKDLYAYFNNDAYGYAVKNALRLKELIAL